MSDMRDRLPRTGNDAVAERLIATKRRRIWHIVIGANVAALVSAIVGCFFMLGSQGVQADVAQMRNEIGETMTMMSLGGASEAVARHIPRLIDTAARWDRKFAQKTESFRGLDAEINQVQAMHRLGETGERWRRELEGVSPMQRNELWQKSIKAQVEGEQKKWPNRTHRKDAYEWAVDLWKEFWFGMKHGFLWPHGIYERTVEVAKSGRFVDRLGPGDRLHYILFPYRLSAFTMLRLLGIAFVTSGMGYLLCWAGLKSRFGWLSYVGLFYFLYLLMTAVFIVFLEVTK